LNKIKEIFPKIKMLFKLLKKCKFNMETIISVADFIKWIKKLYFAGCPACIFTFHFAGNPAFIVTFISKMAINSRKNWCIHC